MKQKSPVISIVTVVFNNATLVEKTIRSVIDQDYPDIEYIIVDGGSSDGTLDVIRKYDHQISKWISEPDRGLYDAMNKGLGMATGDYIWYINSGDEIYGPDTVSRIVKDHPGLPDIIYGDTVIINPDGTEVGDRRLKPPEHLSWKSFQMGMVVCHQSILVKRGLAVGFDLSYRISSDIDWAIRSTKIAGSIAYSKFVFSKFMEGGLSRKNLKEGLRERLRILSKYYGLIPTLFRHVFFGFRLAGFYLVHRRI